MKKVFLIITLVLLLAVGFTGCDESNGGNGDDTQVTTQATKPKKTPLSAVEFQQKIDSIPEIAFETEVKDDKENLGMFPYTGLTSCVKVSANDVDCGFFYVFDNSDNAKQVIEDSREMNYYDYQEETGENFDKLWQNGAVVEQVENTLLTVSAEDENIKDTILNAIKY